MTRPSIDSELPSASPSNKQRAIGGQYCVVLTSEPPPGDAELVAAWKTLEARTGLVPAGNTCLLPAFEPRHSAPAPSFDQQHVISVSAFYIDRHAVTNEQFERFVIDGGYDREELWPPEVCAHLLQFRDQKGHPGPRFWSAGKPPIHKRNHPVVGISWFEANAYARWSGKRLPTAAEWQRAASWSCTQGAASEARYPWGNAFDPQRANTWHSGRGDTVAVDDYPLGATTNGIRQLIGNTWEWTSDGMDARREGNSHIIFESLLAEIRGGAFDTYLETQATCQFRTGQPPLYRRPNIGFRCCISAQDLPCPPDPASLLEIHKL
jgi:iron(II)-dependent oxidoreductase